MVVVTERLAEIKEDEEKQRLEDMSEDEYDAMTEEEKARVDRRRLASKKERLRKYELSHIVVYMQADLCKLMIPVTLLFTLAPRGKCESS